MGRFGSLFKKSDKDKPESNPYAQQPPAAQSQSQSSPPPQYDQYTQYNNSQYNDNRSISQPPLGQPSGLPTGPRPGGLPSRVAPGPNTSYGDDKSPPPQYSPYGRGSPSLGSAGGTPVLPSNTSSPSMSNGFPREKYGASDGVGRNRFEPAPSPYGGSGPSPAQRQGGYGNLDDSDGGGLFANYNGPAKQTTSPRPGQAGAPYGDQQTFVDTSNMTEEERQEAELAGTKGQIIDTMSQTNDVGRRIRARMIGANEQMGAMNNQLLVDSGVLNEAELNMDKTKYQADVSGVNLDDLDAANSSMFNFVANSKARVAARADKKMNLHRQHEMMRDQTSREQHNLDQKLEIERQRLEAAKPKGLLGAAAKHKTDHSQFEFEDDTGEQRELNNEYDEIMDDLVVEARKLRLQAQTQNFILKDQVEQIGRMTDKAQIADDTVMKQRVRLDTRYNKR